MPDGILLEQRHRESHHNEYRHDLDIEKSIVRLKQTPDGRYTPIEGRYPSFENEIESTYIIRPPITENYNFILPAFRPSFGGSTFQIPSKQTHSKLFRDKNLSYHNLFNQHNLVSDLQQPRRVSLTLFMDELIIKCTNTTKQIYKKKKVDRRNRILCYTSSENKIYNFK